MAIFTKFLNLLKPQPNDYINVEEHLGKNYDKIDEGIEKISNEKLDKGAVSEEYNTAKKIEDKIKETIKKAERLPIGSILDYPVDAVVPPGFLPLDGREILQSQYPELYKLLAASSDGKKYLAKIVTIAETGKNNLGEWRIYSDGYMEQWGSFQSSGGVGTATMPKAYKDLNYIVSGSHITSHAIYGYGVTYLTEQSFKVYGQNYENSQNQYFSGTTKWFATGYAKDFPKGTTRKIIKALNLNQSGTIETTVAEELNSKIDSNTKNIEKLTSRLDSYTPTWG